MSPVVLNFSHISQKVYQCRTCPAGKSRGLAQSVVHSLVGKPRSEGGKKVAPFRIRQSGTTFIRLYTGMKYYNASHVINEYGELMKSMTKGPIIFDECVNEVYWMSDYLGTKFRYPCCLNAVKRLTIAWAVISELSVLLLTLRFCFSLPFDDDYNREWLFNVEKLFT